MSMLGTAASQLSIYDMRVSSVAITSDTVPVTILRADIDRVWFGLYTHASPDVLAVAPQGLTPVAPGVGTVGRGITLHRDIPGVEMRVAVHGSIVTAQWTAITIAPVPVPAQEITVMELVLRRPPRWLRQPRRTRSRPLVRR